MSVKVMGHVWDLKNIDPRDKFVLLAYVDHANHEGYNIYPSIDTIAKKTGYSRRTVQRATMWLEEEAKLLIPDGKGPHGTNKWRYNWHWGGCQRDTGGCQRDTGGVSTSHVGGVSVTPEPSLTVNKPSYIADDGSDDENILDFPDIQPKEKRNVEEIKQGIVNALAEYEGNLEPLMEAIDKVSVTNTNWHSKTSQRFLRTLRDDCKATPQKIQDFGQWWRANHWLGQKGNPPRLQQIYEEWPKFENNNHTGFRM